MLNIQFDGVPHSALADAKNTACAHAAIIRRKRREPEPLPSPAEKPINAASGTVLSEKLRQCIQIEEQEQSTSKSATRVETP
jgi:hypothetical protein